MPEKKETVEAINAEINRIDAEINRLRELKRPLAARRAILLANQEIMAKLGHMSKEQRERIVLKPHPAIATGSTKLNN